MIRLTAVIDLEGQGARALTHESNARSFTIGRDATADFQIPLTTVSRQHVRITEADNVYTIEDLGSTHGTLVNGKKLEGGDKKVLRDGDVVEITKAKITCNIEASKVASVDPSEGTQAIAERAVQGILGRLGEASHEGPFLRVLVGPEEGQRFTLGGAQTEWALGRATDCEFILNDPNVSRRHAIVKKDWNGFTIQDLGSKNGVLINERRIVKAKRLRDADEITIGPVKLVFIDPDAELMAALSDVPGFEDSGESDVYAEEPEPVGAPEAEPEAADELPEVQPEPAPPQAMDEEDDEYADIDPELLAMEKRRFPTEWLVIGSVGLVILICLFFLLLVL